MVKVSGNIEVQKTKYGNGSTEAEVRKWEKNPPISIDSQMCVLSPLAKACFHPCDVRART